jgi:hypothetical protein
LTIPKVEGISFVQKVTASVGMLVSSDLLRACFLLIFAWSLLFLQGKDLFVTQEFSDNSAFDQHYSTIDVLTRLEINAAGHVYPYTATAVTFSCLLAVVMVIICMGGQLG